MESGGQFQRLLPLLALAGVGVVIAISFPVSRKRSSAVSQERKKVRYFDYFIKEHTSAEKDYIHCLPDDILCHIISFLDMRDAVRTSVLSRRWRKLYCTLLNPKFECHKMFDNSNLDYKQRFVSVVHKMFEFVGLTDHDCHRNCDKRFVTAIHKFLHLRPGVPLESFTLRFCMMRKFPVRLQRCLNRILRFGVRKLDIDFSSNDNLLKIPDSELIVFPFKLLLNASMLECVQLSFCLLELNLQRPFNLLKELSLFEVPLLDGEVTSILSSCPQLRLLHLECCKLPCKLFLNALELKNLKIVFCEQVNEIGLSAPKLDLFDYYGNCGLSFSPSYVPNLGTLYLSLELQNGPPHGFGGFVLGAPSLHTLWIKAFPYQVRYIQTEMPRLWNLHTLSLLIFKESLDLGDIMSLIVICPNLSEFELSTPLCSLSYTERDAEVHPTCSHLKLVSVDGFKFESAQEKFVSKLIRCTPALEEMRLYIPYCQYDSGIEVEKTLPPDKRVFSSEKMGLTKLLLERQAASSSAVVDFFL